MPFHSLLFDVSIIGVVSFFVALLVLLSVLRRGPFGASEDTVVLSIIRNGKPVEVRTTRVTYSTHGGPGFAVAWSPDGRYLAAVQQSTVRVWLVRFGQLVFNYTGHASAVRSLAWSPRGVFHLASGGEDHSIQHWIFHPRGDLQQFKASVPHEVLSLAWSPSGDSFVCGGDTCVRLYSGAWPLIVSSVFGEHLADPVQSIAWSPDGKYIATSGYDGYVYLWSAVSQRCVVVYASLDTEVTALAFNPSGTSLVASYIDGVVRVWRLPERDESLHTPVRKPPVMRSPSLAFREHARRVTAVAVSPGGTWVASGGVEKTINVWNLETGALRFAYPSKSHVFALSWSPNGKQLAVGSSDTPLHVIRVPS